MSEKKIFSYGEDYGRGYQVEGVFVGTDEDIARICKRTINFGEICGKHSEMCVDFVPEDFRVVPSTPEIIAWFEEHIGYTGHDPRQYLRCPECGASWGDGELSVEGECEQCDKYREEENDDTRSERALSNSGVLRKQPRVVLARRGH